ncbi:MAG: hypothetical protein AABY18_09340 [Candidatus Thermoplasmatota archaeon]
MHPLKTTSAALAGVAVLSMIVVQFAPWASFETSSSSPGVDFGFGSTPGFNFDVEMTSFLWEAETTVNGGSQDTSWYDSDMDDADGIGQIRTAIPMLLVGGVVVLAGALLGAARPGSTGAVLTLAGGVLLTVGTILFGIGTDNLYGDADYSWAVSFYFAIVACALAVGGGLVSLMASNQGAKASF